MQILDTNHCPVILISHKITAPKRPKHHIFSSALFQVTGIESASKVPHRDSNKDPWEPWEVSICGACYLAHQRHPPLDCPCQILELVQPGVPMAADAALGTQPLVDPHLIHPVGIYHFAGESWNRCCRKDGNEIEFTIGLQACEKCLRVIHE